MEDFKYAYDEAAHITARWDTDSSEASLHLTLR